MNKVEYVIFAIVKDEKDEIRKYASDPDCFYPEDKAPRYTPDIREALTYDSFEEAEGMVESWNGEKVVKMLVSVEEIK